MATERQAETSRANAQQSTGPRSDAGKARSSMNALKFGIFAAREVIRGEDPAKLQELAHSYTRRWNPRNNEELIQVKVLIRCDWELDRLAIADTHLWEHAFQEVDGLEDNRALGQAFTQKELTFSRLARRQDMLRRAYKAALHELERLTALPDPPDILDPDPQSEPVPQPEPVPGPQSEQNPSPQPTPSPDPAPAAPPNPQPPESEPKTAESASFCQPPPAIPALAPEPPQSTPALASPTTPNSVTVICRLPPRNKARW